MATQLLEDSRLSGISLFLNRSLSELQAEERTLLADRQLEDQREALGINDRKQLAVAAAVQRARILDRLTPYANGDAILLMVGDDHVDARRLVTRVRDADHRPLQRRAAPVRDRADPVRPVTGTRHRRR